MPNKTGLLISLEGIDGAGKSTQAKLLANHLSQYDTVLTREPGGSGGAEDIRRLLVEGDAGRWSAETEILLFTAARRDHLERVIEPAIAKGHIVITDRFADSTRVYQGAVRASLREKVDALHDMMIGRDPALTLIIDMDPKTALDRGLARGNEEERFESFGLDFQMRLRAGFLNLAQDFSERCRVIDGAQTPDEIASKIAEIVDAYLAAHYG